MGTKKEHIKSDTGGEKPAWRVWGTKDYEKTLPERFPDADSGTINSLIQTTRRIAEKERQKRQR